MDKKTRFLWGGVGGIALSLVSAVTIDPKTTFVGLTLGVLFVWLVKLSAQFIVGGVSVFWDDQEVRIPKLIQSGVAAPVLIASLLTGISGSVPGKAITGQLLTPQFGDLIMIEMAYADGEDTGEKPVIAKNYEDSRNAGQAVKQGLGLQTNLDFVISKETNDLKAAIAFANDLSRALTEKNLLNEQTHINVQLYNPYKDKLKYTVVLGENLTHDQADEMLSILLKNDFHGVERWNLQCECWPDREKAK